jgi:aryl-alcohol dehydrogenase-like predicted oxidoreductase
MYNLLEQLDENKHKFGWIGDYDTFLFAQVLPHISNSLKVLDEQNRETLYNFIDRFLEQYRKMVAFECSRATRATLKENFAECSLSMQECALNFLMQRESIDFILVGMRKPSYVHEVMALLD